MTKRDRMGDVFEAAMVLAASGHFRTVADVEAALGRRGMILPDGKIVRGLIDGACLRARRAKRREGRSPTPDPP
jgi:hypothetical protein